MVWRVGNQLPVHFKSWPYSTPPAAKLVNSLAEYLSQFNSGADLLNPLAKFALYHRNQLPPDPEHHKLLRRLEERRYHGDVLCLFLCFGRGPDEAENEAIKDIE
jgi:hypothetical protein